MKLYELKTKVELCPPFGHTSGTWHKTHFLKKNSKRREQGELVNSTRFFTLVFED